MGARSKSLSGPSGHRSPRSIPQSSSNSLGRRSSRRRCISDGPEDDAINSFLLAEDVIPSYLAEDDARFGAEAAEYQEEVELGVARFNLDDSIDSND